MNNNSSTRVYFALRLGDTTLSENYTHLPKNGHQNNI